MKTERGFSLIEILLVVAVLGIITAAAIPGLRKAKQTAETASAVSSMRTITTAQILYFRKADTYGTLAELAPEGTLDPAIGVGQKSGYAFVLTVDSTQKKFTCTASPIGDTQTMFFFVDETTVIRFNSGAPADVNSPPIPR